MENIIKEIKKSQRKSVRFFDLMNTRTWWLCCTNWTSASSDLDACINWEVQAGRGWVTCQYSRLLSILTAKPLAVRKMVPSEDMCLLAMNILYSSNHKKKVSVKFVEENMCDDGYRNQYLSIGGYSKKRSVKLGSTGSFNTKQVVRTSFLGPRCLVFPPPDVRFST